MSPRFAWSSTADFFYPAERRDERARIGLSPEEADSTPGSPMAAESPVPGGRAAPDAAADLAAQFNAMQPPSRDQPSATVAHSPPSQPHPPPGPHTPDHRPSPVLRHRTRRRRLDPEVPVGCCAACLKPLAQGTYAHACSKCKCAVHSLRSACLEAGAAESTLIANDGDFLCGRCE